MASGELLDIVKVVETSSQEEANKFLAEGWKLINTYRNNIASEMNEQAVVYVLGKYQE